MQVIEFMEESDTFLPPVVRFNGIDTVVSISRLAAFTGAVPMLPTPFQTPSYTYLLHNHTFPDLLDPEGRACLLLQR